jgi:hypothetical protein
MDLCVRVDQNKTELLSERAKYKALKNTDEFEVKVAYLHDLQFPD